MPAYVNNNYFSEQNANMAYIIGFLSADGNVSKRGNRIQSQLSIKDKNHLEKIQKEIGGCEVYEYESNGYKSCGWYCYSAQIKKDLADYGVIPNKTGTISIPKKLNKKYWRDFIRGYFDGDGSIAFCKNKKGVISIGSIQVSFIGATSFIIGLNEILQVKIQINEKIIKEKNPMTSNLFFSSIDHTKKFLDFIYKGSTIYLDRKYERYLIFNKKYEEYLNKKLR